MPDRVLPDRILKDDRLNRVSPLAELLFRRLLSVVDDYGAYESDIRVIRAYCYPLKVDRIREADISRWIQELETAGLIAPVDTSRGPAIQVHLDYRPRKPKATRSKVLDPPRQQELRLLTSLPPPKCECECETECEYESGHTRAEAPPHIPSWQEFHDSFMSDAMPEDWLRQQYSWFDDSHNWISKAGTLKKWQNIVRIRWSQDRVTWSPNNARKSVSRRGGENCLVAGTKHEGCAEEYGGLGPVV